MRMDAAHSFVKCIWRQMKRAGDPYKREIHLINRALKRGRERGWEKEETYKNIRE